MSEQKTQNKDVPRREMGWPAAATLITAFFSAAATTVAWAIVPPETARQSDSVDFVSTREIGEVKARLEAIEESTRQMRTELRSEIKDVRDLVRQLLKQQ
ncbi:MAG: hypothetical protein MI725_16845 [Pirellulales bacterium]|nr:hypothetical protein [Pirellulales bacterium]